jgi:hypothetical protein
MTTSVWTEGSDLSSTAGASLNLAARFWFLTAVIGQWIFVAYVASFYGIAALRGDFTAWNKRYIPGDFIGNVALAVHLVLAVIILAGGPLQLIPQLRRRAPAFHRWNGRIYLPAVFLTSMAGLYMVWVRGTAGDFVQHVGVSLDAVLIMIFAVLALRFALARDLATHRRWALRLFMVVNGVWFFRVGLMLWLFLNHGPAGFDPKTFTGPFLNFLSFANYLLPLAILEIYLQARDRGSAGHRFAVAAGLFVVTLAMAVGIFAATMVMWLPHIKPSPAKQAVITNALSSQPANTESRVR